MNYFPFVSWGIYGGTSAKERANFFASWGLMASLPQVIGAAFLEIVMHYYRRLRG